MSFKALRHVPFRWRGPNFSYSEISNFAQLACFTILFESCQESTITGVLSWRRFERIVHEDDFAWFGLPQLDPEKPVSDAVQLRLLQKTDHVADFDLRIARVIH